MLRLLGSQTRAMALRALGIASYQRAHNFNCPAAGGVNFDHLIKVASIGFYILNYYLSLCNKKVFYMEVL